MRFLTSTLLLLASLSLTTAQPTDHKRTNTLSTQDVNTLVGAYVSLLTNYTKEISDKYISPSFTDTSDSINILAGAPLGSVTFPSKEAFDAHEEESPDNLPVQVSKIGPVSDSQITLIWTAAFPQSVRGITILGVTKESGCWQISSIDVEFNSIAFLQNIGGSVTLPSAPAST